MKQQIGSFLSDLGNNQPMLILALLVMVSLMVVAAIVVSSVHDMKMQRAWVRRCSQQRPRRRDFDNY
jgi:hypothetical protein